MPSLAATSELGEVFVERQFGSVVPVEAIFGNKNSISCFLVFKVILKPPSQLFLEECFAYRQERHGTKLLLFDLEANEEVDTSAVTTRTSGHEEDALFVRS